MSLEIRNRRNIPHGRECENWPAACVSSPVPERCAWGMPAPTNFTTEYTEYTEHTEHTEE